MSNPLTAALKPAIEAVNHRVNASYYANDIRPLAVDVRWHEQSISYLTEAIELLGELQKRLGEVRARRLTTMKTLRAVETEVAKQAWEASLQELAP